MRLCAACLVNAALLTLLAGCAPKVRVTPFSSPPSHPPRPADHPIRMFSTLMPQCPYEELGLVSAEPETGLTPWRRVVEGLLTHARQLGGDGVILSERREIRETADDGVATSRVLAGTVIRFRDPACRR